MGVAELSLMQLRIRAYDARPQREADEIGPAVDIEFVHHVLAV